MDFGGNMSSSDEEIKHNRNDPLENEQDSSLEDETEREAIELIKNQQQ